jgi:hypothetical protein
MIRPTKHMDLNTCVISVVASILSELQQTKAIPLDELDESIQTRINDTARLNFIPALSLLFLLGRIDYDEEADAIVYQTVTTGGGQ